MAVTVDARSQAGPPERDRAVRGFRNDAFTFWKLPESWRERLEPVFEHSEEFAQHYLYEEYLSGRDRRPPTTIHAYYWVKALIPAPVRFRLNAAAIRFRRRREFPHWPCETALIDSWRGWLHVGLEAVGASDGWHIGFWPKGKRCAIVLTHDVESLSGMKQMERMADLEEGLGFRSAWNLPLAQYDVDWSLVRRLRARGFEFGAHGLCHDGRLFRSESDFIELAPILERLAHVRGLTGFRAPSTLRRAEWISALAFDFDSSFSDSDPYEPQPGGTCSIFPFFLSELVELPYTMPQDHTLIHLLHKSPLTVWTTKAQWIASLGGMVLTLTHPDYCGSGAHFSEYEALLKRLGEIESAWRALPSEAAGWWRERAAMRLVADGAAPRIEGPGAERAAPVKLSSDPLAI